MATHASGVYAQIHAEDIQSTQALNASMNTLRDEGLAFAQQTLHQKWGAALSVQLADSTGYPVVAPSGELIIRLQYKYSGLPIPTTEAQVVRSADGVWSLSDPIKESFNVPPVFKVSAEAARKTALTWLTQQRITPANDEALFQQKVVYWRFDRPAQTAYEIWTNIDRTTDKTPASYQVYVSATTGDVLEGIASSTGLISEKQADELKQQQATASAGTPTTITGKSQYYRSTQGTKESDGYAHTISVPGEAATDTSGNTNYTLQSHADQWQVLSAQGQEGMGKNYYSVLTQSPVIGCSKNSWQIPPTSETGVWERRYDWEPSDTQTMPQPDTACTWRGYTSALDAAFTYNIANEFVKKHWGRTSVLEASAGTANRISPDKLLTMLTLPPNLVGTVPPGPAATSFTIPSSQSGSDRFLYFIQIFNAPISVDVFGNLSVSETAYSPLWHESGHFLDYATANFSALPPEIKYTKGAIPESIGDIFQLIIQYYAHDNSGAVYPQGVLNSTEVLPPFTGQYKGYSFLVNYENGSYLATDPKSWTYGVAIKMQDGTGNYVGTFRNMAYPASQGQYGVQEWDPSANTKRDPHVVAGILNRMTYFLLAGAKPYDSADPLTSKFLPNGMPGLISQLGEEKAFDVLGKIFYQAMLDAHPTTDTSWVTQYRSTWHYWRTYWEKAATKLYGDQPDVLKAVKNAFIGVNVQSDTDPPIVTITAVNGDLNAKGGYLPTTLTVKGTVRDEASSVVAMAYQVARPDGSEVCVNQTIALNPKAPAATDTPYSQTLSLSRCADGNYRLSIAAIDASNTTGSVSRDFTINSQDGTPPVLTSLSVNNVGDITGLLTDDFWMVGTNSLDPGNVDLFYSRPGLGYNNVPLWTIFRPASSLGSSPDGSAPAYVYNVTNAEMASGTGSLVNGAYTISGQAVDNANNVSQMLYAQTPWVIYTDYAASFNLVYGQDADMKKPYPAYIGKDVYFEAGADHGKLGITDANMRQLTLWAPLHNRWLYSSVTDSVGYYDDYAFGGVAQLGRNDPWNQYGDELTTLSGYIEDNAGNQTGTGAYYQSYVDTVTPMLVDQAADVVDGGVTEGADLGVVTVDTWIFDPVTQGVHTAKDHIATSDIELYAVSNNGSYESYPIHVDHVDLYKPDGLHITGQLLTSDESGVIVPNGDYVYYVTAKDQAGNELSSESEAGYTFTVNNDLEPPRVNINTLTSNPDRAQLNTSVTFTDNRDLRNTRLTWQGRSYNSGSMINISAVTAPQGGGDLPEPYTESQTLTPTVDGRYQVFGEAWDAVSNHGEKTSEPVMVDYYAPMQKIKCTNCLWSSVDGQYYAGYAPLSVIADAIDPGSGVGVMTTWLDSNKLVLHDGITVQETAVSDAAICSAAITCQKTATFTIPNTAKALPEGAHVFSMQADDNSPGEGQVAAIPMMRLTTDYTAPILAANSVGGCDQTTNYDYSCQYTTTAKDNLALDRLVLSLPGGVSTTHTCSLSENFTCKSILEAVTSANVVNQTGTIYAIDRSGNQATASLKLDTGYSLNAVVSQIVELDASHTQLTYAISTANRLSSDVALDSVKITLNGVETNTYANTQQRTFTVTIDKSQFEPGTVVSALEVVASGYRYATHYDLPVTTKTVRLNESEPNNYPHPSGGYNSVTVPTVSSGITVDVLYSGGFSNKDDPLDTLVLRKFSIESYASASISVSDGETTLCFLTLWTYMGGDCSVVEYSLSGGAYQEGYCTPTKDTICDLWVTINNFNSSTLNGKKYVVTIHQPAK